ncbi:MAG: glycosyltransferase family 2 protein [Myxococcota bacterium]
MTSRVCVVVVNWNGWRDTVECLESLLALRAVDVEVVVVDNGSTDDSIARLQAWASGEEPFSPNHEDRPPPILCAPREKPIRLHVATEDDAARQPCSGRTTTGGQGVVLLPLRQNGGFAAGVNAGLRYALSDGSFTHVWVLNNDVVVEPDALAALLHRMKQVPSAGMCGSTVCFYDEPGRVHAFGGARYFSSLGLVMHIGRFLGKRRHIAPDDIEGKMAYVFGASMLVSRQMLEQVGLMEAGYFLYFEELDWALRARDHFSLAYAPQSIVYHKAGATAGSSRRITARSARSEYFLVRNRLWLTKRYFRRHVHLVALWSLVSIGARVASRRFDLVRADILALRDGLTKSLDENPL